MLQFNLFPHSPYWSSIRKRYAIISLRFLFLSSTNCRASLFSCTFVILYYIFSFSVFVRTHLFFFRSGTCFSSIQIGSGWNLIVTGVVSLGKSRPTCRSLYTIAVVVLSVLLSLLLLYYLLVSVISGNLVPGVMQAV